MREDRVPSIPPQERVVRELVELVPGDLLRHEVGNARLPQDLRQRRGIAKDVRQVEHVGLEAELIHEEALPMHHLADQALAGGEVAVGPTHIAPSGLPAPGGHGF